MKNRIELAKYLSYRGCKIGAEIGVEQGIYSEKLFQNIPGLQLFCIDSWENRPHVRHSQAETESRERSYKECQERLAPYNATIIRAKSMEAVQTFQDNTLDFVFIDANHEYSHVKDDIREWTKKVKVGGIVAGHDYYITKAGNSGVIDAVDEYARENGLTLRVTDWDDHNPHRDDRQPCWYFIKR